MCLFPVAVLKFNNHHIPTLHARAGLYIRLGENKKAMESYHTIIKHLPEDEWHQGIQVARELVQVSHLVMIFISQTGFP